MTSPTKRLRFLTRKNVGGASTALLDRVSEVTFLPMEAIGEQGELDLSTTRPVDEVQSGYTRFTEGDVVIAKITPCFENGKGALIRGTTTGIGFGTTELHVLTPGPELDGRFLYYVTVEPRFRRLGEACMTGAAGQQRVPEDFVRDFRIPVFPLPRQRAIADYLDRELTRIDALIAAKERVLGLLAEKCRALITRAVTRGLDPNAPFRDSGIPWLGEIPAHWDRTQLRRFVQFLTSGSRGWAEYYSDTGATFLRIGNLTRGSVRLDLSAIQYVDPPKGAEGERTRVQIGDLLFSITAYLGSVAFVDQDIGDAYVNQHIALVRLRKLSGLVSEYAAYAALGDSGQTQLVAQSYGGTKTQLALDDIRELWFPVPPVSEQTAIVEHVDAELSKIDQLRSAAKASIALLRERRSALIAAAVTGQLDVGSAA